MDDDISVFNDDDESFNQKESEDNINNIAEEAETEIFRSHRERELEEFLNELKDKYFSLSIHDSLRVRILSIAPSWSLNKIASEFSTTKHQTRKTKKLKNDQGTLGETVWKCKTILAPSTTTKVHDFLDNDTIGKIMGGQKNVVFEIVDGERMSVPKRLMFLDLRGLHTKFLEDFPHDKIGCSTL